MKLLLDTHLILWWLGNSPALTNEARLLIGSPQNIVSVSAVSMWEIWLKQSLGKLRLPENFDEKLAAEQFESLQLTAAHARRVAFLPWHHRDPFDRMLVAQAQEEGQVLLTADQHVAAYGDFVRLVR